MRDYILLDISGWLYLEIRIIKEAEVEFNRIIIYSNVFEENLKIEMKHINHMYQLLIHMIFILN